MGCSPCCGPEAAFLSFAPAVSTAKAVSGGSDSADTGSAPTFPARRGPRNSCAPTPTPSTGRRHRPVISSLDAPVAGTVNADASAPPAESLPAPKSFLQKRPSHKGYPLYGTEPFLDRFLSEGA